MAQKPESPSTVTPICLIHSSPSFPDRSARDAGRATLSSVVIRMGAASSARVGQIRQREICYSGDKGSSPLDHCPDVNNVTLREKGKYDGISNKIGV